MRVLWLGLVPYSVALQLQSELVAARREDRIRDTLLLLTHPPTITQGRSAQPNHVLADPERLRSLGVQLHTVGRGGDVTYHGPSQLIGYPIVDLAALRPDIHWYLRALEEALISALSTWGVSARRFPPHTGVWVDDRKVAAIGVQVRRWITSHGFALNVEPDLSGFHLIVPCGIRKYGVTSLSEAAGRAVAVAQSVRPVAEAVVCSMGSSATVCDDWAGLSESSRKILASALDPLVMPVLD